MSCAIIGSDYTGNSTVLTIVIIEMKIEREEGRDRFLPEIMMMMAIVQVFPSPFCFSPRCITNDVMFALS